MTVKPLIPMDTNRSLHAPVQGDESSHVEGIIHVITFVTVVVGVAYFLHRKFPELTAMELWDAGYLVYILAPLPLVVIAWLVIWLTKK